MNVARWTPLLVDAFLIELHDLGVLDVVRYVCVAILRAGIDVQNFLRGRSAGKFGEQFVRTREPRADGEIAADVGECVFKRVGVPDADLYVRTRTQQVTMIFVKARREDL